MIGTSVCPPMAKAMVDANLRNFAHENGIVRQHDAKGRHRPSQ
jgi:hypothetical protein